MSLTEALLALSTFILLIISDIVACFYFPVVAAATLGILGVIATFGALVLTVWAIYSLPEAINTVLDYFYNRD